MSPLQCLTHREIWSQSSASEFWHWKMSRNVFLFKANKQTKPVFILHFVKPEMGNVWRKKLQPQGPLTQLAILNWMVILGDLHILHMSDLLLEIWSDPHEICCGHSYPFGIKSYQKLSFLNLSVSVARPPFWVFGHEKRNGHNFNVGYIVQFEWNFKNFITVPAWTQLHDNIQSVPPTGHKK